MPTPEIPEPAALTLPLSPEQREAYQDLYDKYQAEIENTIDPIALDTLNDSRSEVAAILDRNDLYELDRNTGLYADLFDQIKSTNKSLSTLKDQIAAVSAHIATAAAILTAIDKVLTLFPPPTL